MNGSMSRLRSGKVSKSMKHVKTKFGKKKERKSSGLRAKDRKFTNGTPVFNQDNGKTSKKSFKFNDQSSNSG